MVGDMVVTKCSCECHVRTFASLGSRKAKSLPKLSTGGLASLACFARHPKKPFEPAGKGMDLIIHKVRFLHCGARSGFCDRIYNWLLP